MIATAGDEVRIVSPVIARDLSVHEENVNAPAKDGACFSHSLPRHVWQARFYDFNVRTEHTNASEELRYMRGIR
jgi:hypothetical protein